MDAEITALIVALVCLALLTLAVFVRVKVSFNLQGRGDPSGAWALAGGASIGPLAFAGVGARGVPPQVSTHFFRWKLWSRSLEELLASSNKEEEDDDEDDDDEEASMASLRARYDRVARWVDPIDLGLFLFEEKRRLTFDDVDVELSYSFENIMVTSQVMSFLYVVAAVLPEPMVLRQTPTWEFEDRASIDGSATLVVRPGLMVVDVIWFLIRNVRLRRPRTVEAAVGS